MRKKSLAFPGQSKTWLGPAGWLGWAGSITRHKSYESTIRPSFLLLLLFTPVSLHLICISYLERLRFSHSHLSLLMLSSASRISMASIPATAASLGSALKPTNHSDKLSRGLSSVKLASTGMLRSSFPLLRSSRFQVCCAAKPETVQKVMDIVKQQLALPTDTTLTPETQFSSLGADSLDTVEIVMGFEEEFGITVEENNSENIATVQEAADLIEKLLEEKTAAGS